MLNLTIVNKISRHCHSWLARQWLLLTSNLVIACIMTKLDSGLPNGTKLSNFMKYCLCFCILFKR